MRKSDKLLKEPIDYRGGKTLYDKIVPSGKMVYFIVDEEAKEKSSLILTDKDKAQGKEIGKVNLLVIGVGGDCDKVEVGDVIVLSPSWEQVTQWWSLDEEFEFGCIAEHYVWGFLLPEKK